MPNKTLTFDALTFNVNGRTNGKLNENWIDESQQLLHTLAESVGRTTNGAIRDHSPFMIIYFIYRWKSFWQPLKTSLLFLCLLIRFHYFLVYFDLFLLISIFFSSLKWVNFDTIILLFTFVSGSLWLFVLLFLSIF